MENVPETDSETTTHSLAKNFSLGCKGKNTEIIIKITLQLFYTRLAGLPILMPLNRTIGP